MAMVKIARQGRPRRVRARIIGLLAVHKTPRTKGGFFGDSYTITHIPTGYAVRSFIGSKSDALEMMLKLQPLNWNFKKPKPLPRGLKKKVAPIIWPEQYPAEAAR